MFAVISLGGKQYRVRKGEYLTVDRVHHPEGETFAPPVLFATDGDTAILDPMELAKVTVTATVDEHLLGPKIRVFRTSPRRARRRCAATAAASRGSRSPRSP